MELSLRSQFGNGSAVGVRPGRLSVWMVWVFVAAVLFAMNPVSAQTIDLSQDQKQKLKALASDTRDQIQAQRQALKRARMDLMSVYWVYKLDDRKARAAMSQLGSAQQKLLAVQLDNQIKIRQILNADQFAKLQQMMSKRMHGFGAGIALPLEEEVWDIGLGPEVCDKLGLTDDQEKRLERVKHVGDKKPELIGRLRRSAQQLADIYSKYELDARAARQISGSIHRDQASLTAIAYKNQQTIRWWLNSDQFAKLQQELVKKFQQGGFARKHRMEKDQ